MAADDSMSDIPSDRPEYELKFIGADSAAMVSRLESSAGPDAVWQIRDLHAIYFDTPDDALRRRGISFRIRYDGETHIQTVKAKMEAAGGAMKRQEWEYAVTGFTPDFSKLGSGVGKILGGVQYSDLSLAVEVNVQRRKTVITRMSSFGWPLQVEVAIDRGYVAADTKKGNIDECELELKQGELPAFFDFALQAQQGTAMRLSRLSKSASGYLLRDGVPDAASAAPAHACGPHETVDEFIETILGVSIANIIDNERAVIANSNAEAVNRIHASLRRIQSLFILIDKWIVPERIAWLEAERVWLADAVAAAGDCDRFLEEIIPQSQTDSSVSDASKWLWNSGQQARARAYKALVSLLQSDRYAQLLLRMTAFAATHGWAPSPRPQNHILNGTMAELADDILSEQFKHVNQAGQQTGSQIDALQNLYFAVACLESLYPPENCKAFKMRLDPLYNDCKRMAQLTRARRLIGQLRAPNGTAALEMADTFCQRKEQALRTAATEKWKDLAAGYVFWRPSGAAADI